ncbi:MAG: GGDEF domain-containing protein [Desulfatitalea sp.]|nr:GGDEF domain-containing protein [Desulfatitalea sp.]NNJ99947.1 GGDEF domain-containing protein [Desulfatitalea sp.]
MSRLFIRKPIKSNNSASSILSLLEPQILFPLFAVLITVILWSTNYSANKTIRRNVTKAAIALAEEQAETYVSQLMRALREIDQHLKIVVYASQQHGRRNALQALKERHLLPSPLSFNIVILDIDGNLIDATESASPTRVDLRFEQQLRNQDGLLIAVVADDTQDDALLQFSRQYPTPSGAYDGAVVLQVDASYFVSTYDNRKMGNQGIMGLLNKRGRFMVRRSANHISTDGSIPYHQIIKNADPMQNALTLSTSAIDGVVRYVVVRELYQFPLAVIVGVSRAELMADADRKAKADMLRTTGANLLLLVVMGIFWRLSRKLMQSRRQEVETRIEHTKQIEYLAYHDSLTGLPNRSLFDQLLEQSIKQARRNTRLLAVLFLDLDHFKHINDTLGHNAGDQLLFEVAARIKRCLRESDTVARFGGDEFIVLLSEIDAKDYAFSVARKVIDAVGRPFVFQDRELRVTASVGISTFPDEGLDRQTLTKHADAAMYKVKEEGKNDYRIYTP